MKLAICDDDPIALNHLSALCRTFSYVDDVRLFFDAETLLSSISIPPFPDVLLMDIDFGSKKNGIDYMAELHISNPRIKIIYVTGYSDRFVQHIFLQPSTLVGFLTKPVQRELLSALLSKTQHLIDEDKHSLLVLSGKEASETIACSSIDYLESSGHRIYIYTDSDRFSTYDRLAKISEQLPSNFLQCHKSFLVNMDKIKRIEKNFILLQNGKEIPISKAHYRPSRETYFKYMQNSL